VGWAGDGENTHGGGTRDASGGGGQNPSAVPMLRRGGCAVLFRALAAADLLCPETVS
jgi:hypothetical protein